MNRVRLLLLVCILCLPNYGKAQADSLLAKARALSWQGGYFDQAHLISLKALDLFKQAKDTSGQIRAYFLIGRGYYYKNNLELALRYVLKAEELEKDFSGPFVDAPLYLAIGVFYNELQDCEQAMIYYNKSYERYKHTSRHAVFASINNYYGICYYKMGLYEKAMAECRRSSFIYDSINYLPGVIENLPWMAKIEFKKGNIQAAKEHLEQAAVMVSQEHDIRLLALVYKELGALYNNLDLNDSALLYLSKAQYYADSLHQLKQQYEILGHLADHYEKTGNPAKALTFTRQYQKLRDSLDAIQSELIANEMAIEYKANQKEELIDQLNIENQEKSDLLQKQKIIVILSIFGLILAIAISILIYVFYRKTHRSRIALEEKNNQITGLIQELHHRVKNNLQVVSGILKLQANQSEHSETKKHLEGSQQRIKSMALIHEKLYRSERLERVNLVDYFHVLIYDIQTLNKQPGQVIDIQQEFTGTAFHIDVAIPLGLIANELISNAFKHGFTNGKTGQIKIRNRKIANDYYELSVSDNGVGLDKHYMEKMEKTLGLRIINGLVRQIKGKLTVEKEPQTIFKVEYSSSLS